MMRQTKQRLRRLPGALAALALTLAAGSFPAAADDRVAAIFGQGGSIFDETNEEAFETEREDAAGGGSLFGEGSIFDEIRENALTGEAGEQAEDEDSIFRHVNESALNGAAGKTGEEDTPAGAAEGGAPSAAAEKAGAADRDTPSGAAEKAGAADSTAPSAAAEDGASGRKASEETPEKESREKADQESAEKSDQESAEKSDQESAEESGKESTDKANTEKEASLEIPVLVRLSGAAEAAGDTDGKGAADGTGATDTTGAAGAVKGGAARFSIRLLSGKSESAKGAVINTPMPDPAVLTVESGKEAAFGPISFTRAGTYRYVVSEEVPTGAVYNGSGRYEKDGIEYDSARYEAEVRVKKEDGGGLAAELYLDGAPAGTLVFENALAAEEAGAESGTAAAKSGASGGESAPGGTEGPGAKHTGSGEEVSGAESASEAAGQSSARDGSIRVYLAFLIIGSIALIILLLLMRIQG